jgi:hypothetical protein
VVGGAAAHNGAVFDGEDPMPRAGRFLLARWQLVRDLPDGAEARDARGNRQARRLRAAGRAWTVEDALSGPFRRVALHWRLSPGAWRLTAEGVEGPAARISVTADAPLRLALVQGWESPGYGRIAPVPVLRVEAEAPVRRIATRIALPEGGPPCPPRS